MRNIFVLAAVAALSCLSQPLFAADPAAHTQSAAAALSEGTVKSIDKAAGRVILAHGPLANLGMPGMTMPFAVRNPAWLEKLKPGDRIRFRAVEGDGGYVVVLIEPQK